MGVQKGIRRKHEGDITAEEKEVCGCGADMTMWGEGKAVKEI
jgi:hypothetical protein